MTDDARWLHADRRFRELVIESGLAALALATLGTLILRGVRSVDARIGWVSYEAATGAFSGALICAGLMAGVWTVRRSKGARPTPAVPGLPEAGTPLAAAPAAVSLKPLGPLWFCGAGATVAVGLGLAIAGRAPLQEALHASLLGCLLLAGPGIAVRTMPRRLGRILTERALGNDTVPLQDLVAGWTPNKSTWLEELRTAAAKAYKGRGSPAGLTIALLPPAMFLRHIGATGAHSGEAVLTILPALAGGAFTTLFCARLLVVMIRLRRAAGQGPAGLWSPQELIDRTRSLHLLWLLGVASTSCLAAIGLLLGVPLIAIWISGVYGWLTLATARTGAWRCRQRVADAQRQLLGDGILAIDRTYGYTGPWPDPAATPVEASAGDSAAGGMGESP